MGPNTMYTSPVGIAQESKWKLTQSFELEFSALAQHTVSAVLHMLLQYKYTHMG